MRRMTVRRESWPLAKPFVISSGSYIAAEVIVVEVSESGHVGRGEAAGVFFRGETVRSILAEVEAVRATVEAGATRAGLAEVLAAGGARNAIDCALWELEALESGRSVAALAGLSPIALDTVATVGLASPTEMAIEAGRFAPFDVLKLKLGADDPIGRVRAVRAARPTARLIVDVNAGWSVAELATYAPACAALGVEMIEQPCPPEIDGAFVQADFAVTLCADESCRTTADLDRLAGRYGMINIKLDKTGGLTEALALARTARTRGFGLMVGNMIGTSLAMAPASLIGGMCRYVDLDGPLLLANEREPAMPIAGSTIAPLVPAVWG